MESLTREKAQEALGLLERLVAAQERLAVANERLNELATEERADVPVLGPPICAHCGTLNPKIRSQGGDGAMADFVLVAICESCGQRFFAVPQGWVTVTTQDDAMQQMNLQRLL